MRIELDLRRQSRWERRRNRRAVASLVFIAAGTLVLLASCTTITTVELGSCELFLAPGEPQLLTYELVVACRDLGTPLHINLVGDPTP